MTDARVQKLRETFGDERVLSAASDRLPFEKDWRGRYASEALAVLKPRSTAEVQAMVRFCAAHGIALVPQGGNTGLVGGSVPTPGVNRPQIILSLSLLQAVRSIDPINNTLTVEAGATLQSVQALAEAHGRLFPLSLASEGSCQVGGILATNAGGIQVLRYGSMRQLVLGLEVVLSNGQLWNGLRGLRKDNTGYDLKHCFIGSEGTLGIITAATLKLYPQPQAQTTVWLGVDSPAQALNVFHGLAQSLPDLSAFELMGAMPLALCTRHIKDRVLPLKEPSPWHVLLQVDVDSERVINALQAAPLSANFSDAVIAQTERQVQQLWALREDLSEAQRLEGPSLKHDISLPLNQIPAFIERAGQAIEAALPGTRVVCFGHLGDGNLHYNLFPPGHYASADALESGPGQILSPIVLDLVAALEGSFSAEHGVGQFKTETLKKYHSPIELDLMRSLKRAWDPQNLLNPGKLFSEI